MKLIISLFFALFLSPPVAMGADERCEEILTISYDELDAARSENRSKRILGKISEESFLSYRELLDARQEELEKLGPRPEAKAEEQNKSASRKKARPDPKFGNLLPVSEFRIKVNNRILEAMDYNPKTKVSLLRLYEPSSQKIHLYKAQDDEVDELAIDPSSYKPQNPRGLPDDLLYAKFLPGEDNLVFVNLAIGHYLWRMGSGVLRKIGTEASHAGNPLKLSNKSNWLYPGWKSRDSSLEIQSTKTSEKQLIQATTGFVAPKIVMSPNEEFIMWTDSEGGAFHMAGMEAKNINLAVFLGDNRKAYDFQMSEDGSLLYIFTGFGEMRYLSVDRLLDARSNPIEKTGQFARAESHSLTIARADEILKTKFSPDGRYFAILERRTKIEAGKAGFDFYKFTLWDNETRQEVYSGDFLGLSIEGVNFDFTYDSQHLYLHNRNKARVFKILGSEEIEPIL